MKTTPSSPHLLSIADFADAVVSRTITDAEFAASAHQFVASGWWVGQPSWEREVGEWADQGLVRIPRSLRPSVAALREYVRARIRSSRKAAERALELVLAQQTQDELAVRASTDRNGVGLTKFDADWAASHPCMVYTSNRRRISKYAAQIVRISDHAALVRSWRRSVRLRSRSITPSTLV